MTPAFFPFRSAEAQEAYLAVYMERAKVWPVPTENKFIETPSGNTFIRVSGRATDPPLILLPGSKGTSLTWIPNIAALSAHYRTYALDAIYDFGLSVRAREFKRPAELVAWLQEVLVELVPDGTASLLGLSYGGWLVSQFALRYPERTQKIVLIDPAATVLQVSFRLIFRALLTLVPIPGFRSQFYYWLLRDTLNSGPAGKAFVDEAVYDWSLAERCFARLPIIAATVLNDRQLEEFPVPCLFLAGEHEKVYSARKAVNRLNHTAPQIQTEIIPNAGHDAWFVQSDIVNKKVLDFLGSNPNR